MREVVACLGVVLDQSIFSKYVRARGRESQRREEGELREYREREERVYVSLRFRLLCICLAIPRVVFVLIMNCTLSYAGSRDLVRQWPAVHNQN